MLSSQNRFQQVLQPENRHRAHAKQDGTVSQQTEQHVAVAVADDGAGAAMVRRPLGRYLTQEGVGECNILSQTFFNSSLAAAGVAPSV